MKEKLKNKRNGKAEKGITLVALVVTIVVLLILAGVSIVNLFGESEIINKAQEIADETKNGVTNNLSDLKDLEGMLAGWQEVKEDGKVIKVKKGKRELDIGDYINYDCTRNASGQTITESYTSYSYDNRAQNDGITSGYSKDQTFKASDYTGKWRVLGAENGELLIMPATNVPLTEEGSTSTTEDFHLSSGNGTSYGEQNGTTYAEQGKAAYKYGPEELDNISKIYAKGKGATGEARSIKVEDVNKIAGYNPEVPAGSEDNKYGKKLLCEYENKITYTWKGKTAPYYTASNGCEPGTLSVPHNTETYGFTYWDEERNDWGKSTYTSTAQTSQITTLTSTYYFYYPETLTTTINGKIIGIANNSKQYDMLFGNSSSEYYWLGSRYIFTNLDDYIRFGLRRLMSYEGGSIVGFGHLFGSYGYGYSSYSSDCGVRPVVSLSSDVELEKGPTVGGVPSWNIK